ncbi:MAG TPA: carbohydrate ABC transporter permease [Jatrophihabitans sp.]|jgi:multiple sugar transport system permease protein
MSAVTTGLPRTAGRWALTSPRPKLSRLIARLVLVVIVLLFIAPMLWLLLGSLHRNPGLTVPFGGGWTLGNYADVLNPTTFWVPLRNSLILSGGTTIITVVCASLAAYPLSRYRLRFGRFFLYTIVFSTGLPITAIMVPVYSMFAHFNLTDSVTSTVFFMSATSMPFAIWMLKNFMDGVPVSLEEAAWTDGAGWFQGLRHIVLPLMAPGVAVVSIFVFVTQWGDFFIPFILLLDPAKQPLSVTIYTFFSSYGQVQYGQLAAFSVLYTLPIVFLYGVLSKYLGGAFNFAGGVKG